MIRSSIYSILLFGCLSLSQILVAQTKTDICDYQAFVDKGSSAADKEARFDRYLKLIGVVQELGNYRQDFIAEGNLINLFPTAYYHTTYSEMLDIISNKFNHPIEKMQQMLAFYDAYKANRVAYDNNSSTVETHWKDHFDKAASFLSNKVNFSCTGIASTLKTSIIAHVQYDLPRAIRYAKQQQFDPTVSEQALKAEFYATDAIFASTNKKTKKDISSVRACAAWWQSVGEAVFADFIPIYPNDATVVKWRKEAWAKGMGNAPISLAPQPETNHQVLLNLGKKRCKSNQPTQPSKSEAVTLFLLDVSGSMGKPAPGSNQLKIKAAANAGLRTVKNIQQQMQPKDVGVMVFAGGCGKNPGNIQVYISNKLNESIAFFEQNIATGGGTPLPQAIEQAQRVMEDHKRINNFTNGTVVVLSDGASTCGAIRPAQVYAYQANQAADYPSWLRFHTVGFDIPAGSAAERDLQYLAASTGGKYFSAKNDYELTRAFQKVTQSFVAIPVDDQSPTAQSLAAKGTEAFVDEQYPNALSYWTDYHENFPADQAGLYNLAQAQEANERYRSAIESYQKYMDQLEDFDQLKKIEAKIKLLKEDYKNFLEYQKKVLASDLAYLEDYYNRLFDQNNLNLALEFKGFNKEKSGYYGELPDILELDQAWLVRESKAVSRGLNKVYKSLEKIKDIKKDSERFVTDAIAKLGQPVMSLRKLVQRIEEEKIVFPE